MSTQPTTKSSRIVLGTPRTFHPFARLLVELRLQIWRETMQPRVVDVELSFRGEKIATRAANPVALSVNFESREEALKKYKLLFHRVYFNRHIDTLYFPFPGNPFLTHSDNSRRVLSIPNPWLHNQNFMTVTSYREAYKWPIEMILEHRVGEFGNITQMALDNFSKGARRTGFSVTGPIEIYDLTSMFPALTEIVVYWADSLQAELVPHSPPFSPAFAMGTPVSEHEHAFHDDVEMRLTRQALAAKDQAARPGSRPNQHSKVAIRYQKVHPFGQYAIRRNQLHALMMQPGWTLYWTTR